MSKKIILSLKDPDGIYESLDDYVNRELEDTGLDDSEKELLYEHRFNKYSEILKKWVEYGEYVRLEIDFDSNTIKVVPNE